MQIDNYFIDLNSDEIQKKIFAQKSDSYDIITLNKIYIGS